MGRGAGRYTRILYVKHNNKITLTYEFNTQEELQIFLLDMNNMKDKKTKPKKENDRRGCGIAELHKRVKEYKQFELTATICC